MNNAVNIVNPKTGESIKLFSELGQNIVKFYYKYILAGGELTADQKRSLKDEGYNTALVNELGSLVNTVAEFKEYTNLAGVPLNKLKGNPDIFNIAEIFNDDLESIISSDDSKYNDYNSIVKIDKTKPIGGITDTDMAYICDINSNGKINYKAAYETTDGPTDKAAYRDWLDNLLLRGCKDNLPTQIVGSDILKFMVTLSHYAGLHSVAEGFDFYSQLMPDEYKETYREEIDRIATSPDALAVAGQKILIGVGNIGTSTEPSDKAKNLKQWMELSNNAMGIAILSLMKRDIEGFDRSEINSWPKSIVASLLENALGAAFDMGCSSAAFSSMRESIQELYFGIELDLYTGAEVLEIFKRIFSNEARILTELNWDEIESHIISHPILLKNYPLFDFLNMKAGPSKDRLKSINVLFDDNGNITNLYNATVTNQMLFQMSQFRAIVDLNPLNNVANSSIEKIKIKQIEIAGLE